MYNTIYNQNEWLTGQCPWCNSVNHIFIDKQDAFAWECYNCFTKNWLDDAALVEYTVLNDITLIEADEKLENTSEITTLRGQFCK